jgi:hypothetical protein
MRGMGELANWLISLFANLPIGLIQKAPHIGGQVLCVNDFD